MQRIGKEIVCDRCGYREFIEKVPDSKGNYTYVSVNGWSYMKGKHCNGSLDLCPDCTNEYNAITENFMNGKKPYAGGVNGL